MQRVKDGMVQADWPNHISIQRDGVFSREIFHEKFLSRSVTVKVTFPLEKSVICALRRSELWHAACLYGVLPEWPREGSKDGIQIFTRKVKHDSRNTRKHFPTNCNLLQGGWILDVAHLRRANGVTRNYRRKSFSSLYPKTAQLEENGHDV